MKQYKVRIRRVKGGDVEGEAENDDDAEDAAADLYYRGDVGFPEGSPFMEIVILDSVEIEPSSRASNG